MRQRWLVCLVLLAAAAPAGTSRIRLLRVPRGASSGCREGVGGRTMEGGWAGGLGHGLLPMMRLRGGYDFYDGGDGPRLGESWYKRGAAQKLKSGQEGSADGPREGKAGTRGAEGGAEEEEGWREGLPGRYELDENGLEPGFVEYDLRQPEDVDQWTQVSDSNGTVRISGHNKEVKAMAVVRRGEEGEVLVTGDGLGVIMVWDSDSMRCLRVLHGHRHGVACLCLSGDGGTLYSGGWDNDVWAWDTGTWEGARVVRGVGEVSYSVHVEDNPNAFVSHPGHDAAVLAVCTIGGERLASGDMHGVIAVWDTGTWKRVATLEDHVQMVWALAEHREVGGGGGGSLLISGGEDWTVVAWSTETWRVVRRFGGHTGPVRCLLSVGMAVITGSSDCTIRVWDAQSGACHATSRAQTGWVMGLCASADCSQLAAACSDGSVYLLDTETWQLKREEERHGDWATCAAMLRGDTHLASGSHDMDVIVAPLR